MRYREWDGGAGVGCRAGAADACARDEQALVRPRVAPVCEERGRPGLMQGSRRACLESFGLWSFNNLMSIWSFMQVIELQVYEFVEHCG